VFKLDLLFEAEIELSDAYDWYEEQQIGLGNRLFNEVNHYLHLVETNPFHFQIRYKGELRTAPLKIFPYLIIYWIDESKSIIFVVSIFHTSRNPRIFR
jgi:toxin ParE1/3/4